ncbi:MAG TPA: class I SAM-dependent methyltransferase [Burkholderiales bacterium]|nr:class I SAM-dependent methyltransferase [Burkholderiales bacterium]
MNERDFHDHHYGHDAQRILESPLFSRVHERAARDFLRCTGCGPKHRVLSLGCGDGSIERRLAPHVGQIVGMDLSAVAIEQAQAKARAAGLGNLTFLVSDPESLSLEALGQFDVVAAFAFLHHLEDAAIRETLRAANRALRPGGVFYSSDPSRRRLVRLFTALVRRTYDRYHSPDERELDPEALAALAGAAGFSQPAIGYTDYFLGPLAWLAPSAPRWLAGAMEALDNLSLRLPLVRRYASSFSLHARA